MSANMMIQACKDYLCKLLVYGILFSRLNITDGGSVTWYEPRPVETTSDNNIELTADSRQLLKGSTHVQLSWNFTLTPDLNLITISLSLNSVTVAAVLVSSGITGISSGFEGRFNVTWISLRATLIIFNVTEDDDGEFGCQLNTFQGVQNKLWKRKMKVEVVVETTFTSSPSGDQTVNEGSDLTLFCNATGKPTPNATWTRVLLNSTDGEVVFFGNPWIIVNINRTAAGTYRCTAYNGIGNPVNHSLYVNVTYQPAMVTLVTNTTENKDCSDLWVNFTCISSEANPPVYNYLLSDDEDGFSLSESGTWVKKISRGGRFIYNCLAFQLVENVTSARNITLTVNVPASVQQVENKNVIEGENVEEYCIATAGNPDPTEMWTNVTSGEHIEGNPLNITNINRAQAGAYKCTANNTCGEASTVMNINVQYGPENVRLITNATGKVCTGVVVNFTCNAEANPPVHTYLLYENDTMTNNMGISGIWIKTMENAGQFVFRCEANNSIQGIGKSGNTTLTVDVQASVTQAKIKNVTEGDNVEVYCNVTAGIPDPTVMWTNVKTGERNKENPLKITNINRTQAGEYKCTANNTCGEAFTLMNINVQYQPDDVHLTTNATDKVCAGIIINFTCIAEANPAVHTYLLYENDTVIYSMGLGTVTKTIKNAGQFVFRCEANNSVQDSGNSRDTVLIVLAPANTVKQAENKITVEGTDVEVNCNVTGIPDPTVIWRNVKSGEISEGNLLNITNITRAQAGEYRCTANHTCGVDSTIVNIDVQYPPKIASACYTIHGSEGSSASISCPVIGNPYPNITWYRGNETSPSTMINTNIILQFPETELDDSGWYTCFAENYLGNITATVQLRVVKSVQTTVTTLPKPTTKAAEECKCSCNDVILAAVVGVLVLIIIGLILYIIWLQKKGTAGKQRHYKEERGVYDNEMALDDLQSSSHIPSKSTQSRSEYMDITEATTDSEETQRVAQSTDYAPLHPSTRSWEVEKQHVTIEKVIGKGAFGQVAKGTATGLLGRPGKTTVAVKMLKYNSPESDRRDLLRELDTMKQLKPHPHVIKLLGCVTETEPLMVIIEYVPYGDLLGYLRKSRGLNDTYYKDPDIKPQTSLNSQQLIKFAWQIADGMSYLSSKSIIHRDLAARNVLVGERETCKVTDFGMARDVQQDNIYEKKTKGRLPVKWTAYEALLYGTYTTKSDIWSYGVALYEIFTIGGSPYPRVNGKRIASLLQEGYRMPKPQHVDDKLYEIMLKCWQNDPDVRPTFSELKTQLKDMENQHKRLINLKLYDHRQLYANVEDLVE